MWDYALLISGFFLLILGADFFVTGASSIATRLKVSSLVIGLTVVAFGTSAPELFISATAAVKNNPAIALGNVLGSNFAIGNIIGSNIFNILLILGVSAMIQPIPIDPNQQTDFIITVATSVILLGAVFFGKRHVLERWHGALFICLYVGYILLKVITDHQ
jgi:cation:H+ antiporter